MKVLVTGAGGFIGRALVKQLLTDETELGRIDSLALLDAYLGSPPEDRRITAVQGDLTDAAARARALGDGVDVILHLAAAPGGASEADPAMSRRTNIDAAFDLYESASALKAAPRVVYTSSIAVFGAPMPTFVDDDTPLMPTMVYGAHKQMMEIALYDYSRRGQLDAVSIRLPGIVARPPGAAGMKSAFMSDVFHALANKTPYVVPVAADGPMWVMSVDQVAWNIIHAATADRALLPARRACTLPSLRMSVGDIVDAVAPIVGADKSLISYNPDPVLQAQFADYPPIATAAADKAGFKHDGTPETLARRALQGAGLI